MRQKRSTEGRRASDPIKWPRGAADESWKAKSTLAVERRRKKAKEILLKGPEDENRKTGKIQEKFF